MTLELREHNRKALDQAYKDKEWKMEGLSLKDKVLGAVRSGQSVSFPIPVMNDDGSVSDCFFVYTVDRKTKVPNKPMRVVEFDREAGEFVESDRFESIEAIEHVPSEFKMPHDYPLSDLVVWDSYGRLRQDLEDGWKGGGEPGRFIEARMAEYAWDVEGASQKCLLPYYKALAPTVFKSMPWKPALEREWL